MGKPISLAGLCDAREQIVVVLLLLLLPPPIAATDVARTSLVWSKVGACVGASLRFRRRRVVFGLVSRRENDVC